jgi:hypothetical protein
MTVSVEEEMLMRVKSSWSWVMKPLVDPAKVELAT